MRSYGLSQQVFRYGLDSKAPNFQALMAGVQLFQILAMEAEELWAVARDRRLEAPKIGWM